MIPLFDLVDSKVITQAQYDLIFRNITEIARANITFFKNLQEKRKEQGPIMKVVGDAVLKHVVFFNVYAEYCGDQKRSTQELRKLISENPTFKQALDTCKANPECRKLDLFAFLLLPMQRLTKYPLLLKVFFLNLSHRFRSCVLLFFNFLSLLPFPESGQGDARRRGRL